MKCECGNEEFFASQQVRMTVVVDGDGNWLRDTAEAPVVDFDDANGPFTCNKCHKVYDELK